MRAQFEQSMAKFEAGDLAGARTGFLAMLEQSPGHAGALRMLGRIALRNRRPARAVAFLERAIAARPRMPAAHADLGIALERMGRREAAIESFKRALALDPTLPRAHAHLTTALVRAGRYADAESACSTALGVLPESDVLLNNRAASRIHQGRPEAALPDIERALGINPRNFGALKNRGAALQAAGRDEEAIDWCNRALGQHPDEAGPHLNRGIALLRQGRLVQGFEDYEWRWRTTGSGMGRNRHASIPQWSGEPLAGKRILLHAEQGLGDSIQFMRYVPLVAEQAAETVLQLPHALVGLARDSLDTRVRVVAGNPQDFVPDLQCPMMSLARAFRTDLDSIPAAIPYLRSDPERVRRHAARLGAGRKIGVVWAGSKAHHNDANRSLPLESLLPLLAQDLDFVCLQKEISATDRAGLAPLRNLTLLDDALDTFADTAAVMELLDLVISVDTSVAHLAGALGRPLWLLLPQVADWRWLTGRDDSPWYPGARLFRQTAPGDWDGLVGRLKRELDNLT